MSCSTFNSIVCKGIFLLMIATFGLMYWTYNDVQETKQLLIELQEENVLEFGEELNAQLDV